MVLLRNKVGWGGIQQKKGPDIGRHQGPTMARSNIGNESSRIST